MNLQIVVWPVAIDVLAIYVNRSVAYCGMSLFVYRPGRMLSYSLCPPSDCAPD